MNNKKSMTEQWMDYMNSIENDTDINLATVTKGLYKKRYKDSKNIKPIPIYKFEMYNDFVVKPHPLLKVRIVYEYHCDYPSGGSDWEVHYLFTYKGTKYILMDSGGS